MQCGMRSCTIYSWEHSQGRDWSKNDEKILQKSTVLQYDLLLKKKNFYIGACAQQESAVTVSWILYLQYLCTTESPGYCGAYEHQVLVQVLLEHQTNMVME